MVAGVMLSRATRRTFDAVLVAIALASVGTFARADITPTERLEARKLADEGFELYTRGDYATALARFEQAETKVKAPTIVLQRARTLERLGRWIEAVKVYEEASGWEITAKSPWQHRTAKADAAKDLGALVPRIPKLRLTVRPEGASPSVAIDGRPLTTSLTEPIPLDPGEHLVKATASKGAVAEHQVTLLPGVTMDVTLDLEPPKPATGRPTIDRLTPLQLAGWVALGVGGATTLAGIGVGIGAAAERGTLAERCGDDNVCPERERANVEAFDGLRWGSTGTLTAGLILTAAGASAVIWGGDETAADATPQGTPTASAWRIQPLLGLGSIGARVRF
jgi:hypothetical protein